MVAQLGQPENNSICSEMQEVGALSVVYDAKGTTIIVGLPLRK